MTGKAHISPSGLFIHFDEPPTDACGKRLAAVLFMNGGTITLEQVQP